MFSNYDDRFMVFVRLETDAYCPEAIEEPLTLCATYEEARRIQRAYRRWSQDCIIRFMGEAGGGD